MSEGLGCNVGRRWEEEKKPPDKEIQIPTRHAAAFLSIRVNKPVGEMRPF